MKKNVIKLTQAQLREHIQKIISEQSQLQSMKDPDFMNRRKKESHQEEPVTQFSYNKPNYKRVFFNNGGNVSIQASSTHYSHPRDNFGPYTEMELGYPSRDTQIPESMLRYVEQGINDDEEGNSDPHDNVYPYVPVSVIKELIELNGGVKSGEVPPMAEEEDSMGREDDLNEQGSDTYNKLTAERDRLKKEIARLEMEIGMSKNPEAKNRVHDKMVIDCLKKAGFKFINTNGKYGVYMEKNAKNQPVPGLYRVISQADSTKFVIQFFPEGGVEVDDKMLIINTSTNCDSIIKTVLGYNPK
jgi:hypothetical protein